MINHSDLTRSELLDHIGDRRIQFGGNKKLKIYGTLMCKSGKRMKTTNRVFFVDANEAREQGYRPCAKCMNRDYKQWRNNESF